MIVALWVGSLWTVGYLVAPALFAWVDDRALAGELAGRFFAVEVWLSLAAAALWLVLAGFGAKVPRAQVWLVAAMIVSLTVMHFVVGPPMRAARAAGADSFALLHGLSSVLYLAASVLGLALIFSDRRPAA